MIPDENLNWRLDQNERNALINDFLTDEDQERVAAIQTPKQKRLPYSAHSQKIQEFIVSDHPFNQDQSDFFCDLSDKAEKRPQTANKRDEAPSPGIQSSLAKLDRKNRTLDGFQIREMSEKGKNVVINTIPQVILENRKSNVIIPHTTHFVFKTINPNLAANKVNPQDNTRLELCLQLAELEQRKAKSQSTDHLIKTKFCKMYAKKTCIDISQAAKKLPPLEPPFGQQKQSS